MPIYEFYCAQNHTVYQFYAKTLAQGKRVPSCPDNPKWTLSRMVSQFAFTGRAKEPAAEMDIPATEGGPEDARMEAAMGAMEREFESVDENDPRAMARLMRRMSELTGEKIDGELEEVVRKLEEGVDPESLENQLGDAEELDGGNESSTNATALIATEGKTARMRRRIHRARTAPRRDSRLYDYT